MNAFLQQLLGITRRYPMAVVSLSLLVVLGVADFFLWKRQADLASRAERVRLEGEAMLLSLSTHPRLEAQETLARQAVTAIDGNLASEADLAGNLDYFYQFEKTARIRLAGVSQLSSTPGPADAPYRSIPFLLRLVGPYNQVLAYLHEIETGPRLIRLRSYRMSQTDSTADVLTLECTVEVLGRP